MKVSSIRWLFVVGVVGAAFAGIISSNVGCGSDEGGKAGGGGDCPVAGRAVAAPAAAA